MANILLQYLILKALSNKQMGPFSMGQGKKSRKKQANLKNNIKFFDIKLFKFS